MNSPKTSPKGKPITPLVGCDVFVVNESGEVLLAQRSDNGRWCLPGGCQDLGESSAECAVRECREETGLEVSPISLIGIYSSSKYSYVYYPFKDNQFTHILYFCALKGGKLTTSEETPNVGWFAPDKLPPLSDGHAIRIEHGFAKLRNPEKSAYFE